MCNEDERKLHNDILIMEGQEFQDNILRLNGQHVSLYVISIKGKTFTIFPETFNPNYAPASLLLANNLGVQKGDVVLDPFTGCGIDALVSVLEGAEKAVAIDKCLMPYLCASYNAHMLELDNLVDVRQGDLFEPLKDGELFSLVVSNPPFRKMAPETDLQASNMDDNYRTLEKFWNGVSNYLTQDGRIRIVFSNCGDLNYFHTLAKQNNYIYQTIATTRFMTQGLIEVYEFVRRGSR